MEYYERMVIQMNRDQLAQLEVGDLITVTRGIDKGIIAKVIGFSEEVDSGRKYSADYWNPVTRRYGFYDKYGTGKFKTEEEILAAGYRRLDRGLVLEAIDPTIIFNGVKSALLSKDRKQRILSYEVCKPLQQD